MISFLLEYASTEPVRTKLARFLVQSGLIFPFFFLTLSKAEGKTSKERSWRQLTTCAWMAADRRQRLRRRRRRAGKVQPTAMLARLLWKTEVLIREFL